MKPDKENRVVILVRKLYNNAIEVIISDTSKFEKLNEDPTLKREATTSAPASIYGTPKMHKFPASDSFLKLRLIASPIGTFNYNLARFLCDLLSDLVPSFCFNVNIVYVDKFYRLFDVKVQKRKPILENHVITLKK